MVGDPKSVKTPALSFGNTQEQSSGRAKAQTAVATRSLFFNVSRSGRGGMRQVEAPWAGFRDQGQSQHSRFHGHWWRSRLQHRR